MRFTLDIDYSPSKMEASRLRMEARCRYEYVDRVPVGFCLEPRYFAPALGIPLGEFYKTDAETQYYWQLQLIKVRSGEEGEKTRNFLLPIPLAGSHRGGRATR